MTPAFDCRLTICRRRLRRHRRSRRAERLPPDHIVEQPGQPGPIAARSIGRHPYNVLRRQPGVCQSGAELVLPVPRTERERRGRHHRRLHPMDQTYGFDDHRALSVCAARVPQQTEPGRLSADVARRHGQDPEQRSEDADGVYQPVEKPLRAARDTFLLTFRQPSLDVN